jgi:hypothetical protein
MDLPLEHVGATGGFIEISPYLIIDAPALAAVAEPLIDPGSGQLLAARFRSLMEERLREERMRLIAKWQPRGIAVSGSHPAQCQAGH